MSGLQRFLVTVIVATQLAGAQQTASAEETIGNAVLTPPRDWLRTESEGTVIFTPPQLPPGRRCALMIMPGQALDKPFPAWFDEAAAAFRGQGKPISGGEVTRAAGADGTERFSTIGTMSRDGKTIAYFFEATHVGQRAESVLFIADGADLYEQHVATVGQVLRSIRYNARATPAATTAATGPAGALDGIYVGLRRIPPTDGSFISNVRLSYVTFFPDGRVLWRLPGEGRDGFDAATSMKAFPDSWGTYRLTGDAVHIDGVERNSTIKAQREGDVLKMDEPKLTLRPVPDCTGWTLDGVYRRSAEEPAITFARDGTFRDEGFMAGFGQIQKNDGTLGRDDGKPGRGTYLIRHNTLHLDYQDGRRKKVAFHVPPGEKPDPSPAQIRIVMESLQRQK